MSNELAVHPQSIRRASQRRARRQFPPGEVTPEATPLSSSGAFAVPSTTTSSSSFDYWWPYPPRGPSTPISTLTPAPQATIPLDPSVSTLTTTGMATPSLSTSLTSSMAPSVTFSVPPPVTSTPTTPSPSATAATHGHINLLYLTPFFALLGILLGATVAGWTYGHWTRRRVRVDSLSGARRDRDMDRGASYVPLGLAVKLEGERLAPSGSLTAWMSSVRSTLANAGTMRGPPVRAGPSYAQLCAETRGAHAREGAHGCASRLSSAHEDKEHNFELAPDPDTSAQDAVLAAVQRDFGFASPERQATRAALARAPAPTPELCALSPFPPLSPALLPSPSPPPATYARRATTPRAHGYASSAKDGDCALRARAAGVPLLRDERSVGSPSVYASSEESGEDWDGAGGGTGEGATQREVRHRSIRRAILERIDGAVASVRVSGEMAQERRVSAGGARRASGVRTVAGARVENGPRERESEAQALVARVRACLEERNARRAGAGTPRKVSGATLEAALGHAPPVSMLRAAATATVNDVRAADGMSAMQRALGRETAAPIRRASAGSTLAALRMHKSNGGGTQTGATSSVRTVRTRSGSRGTAVPGVAAQAQSSSTATSIAQRVRSQRADLRLQCRRVARVRDSSAVELDLRIRATTQQQ